MALTIRQSLWLRQLLTSAGFVFAMPAFAGIEAKTTYDISSYRTESKTEYKKAPLDMDAKFKDKLWERFSAKLKEMPLVGDIHTSEIVEKEEDPGTWADYKQITRNFSAFVQVNLATPMTMLFSIEESRQKCKPSQAGSTISSSCADLNTTLQIKGPIAVYGTFENESNLNISDWLREKQRLMVVVNRSYDKADLVVDTTLHIDSVLFEKNLLKMLSAFNVPMINKKSSEELTRQGLFLSIARILRQSNERMLEL